MKRKTDIFLTEKLDAHFREKWEGTLIAKGKAIGVAEGKAEEKIETGRSMILTVLRARFGKVPKGIEKEIRQISDPIALDSWAAQAAIYESLEEFAEALSR